MFTKAQAEAYFNAEKSESFLFVIVGLLAIALALTLFFYYRTTFYKGFAIPLILVGIIQVVVGTIVARRTDRQRVDIVYKMDMNTAALQTTEIPRMETVMRSFVVYRYVEILLLLAGISTYLYTRNRDVLTFWTGVAIGLMLQAGIMLIADAFAEARGSEYLTGLKQFVQGDRES